MRNRENPDMTNAPALVTHIAAQGDVLFRRVATIPPTHKRDESPGLIVVAHSETGHHHAIEAAAGVTAFRDPTDPLVCYLQLDGVDHCDVVHHRSFDTHGTLRLTGDAANPVVWEVRRQKEFTPEGWRRVED